MQSRQSRPRSALITGVGGQDGVLLARELLAHGRTVVGTVSPGTLAGHPMTPYFSGVTVLEHDVRDGAGFARLLEDHHPDDIFNLAAFSSVGLSWGESELVAETNGMAVLRMLEALRSHRDRHGEAPRFYQASTSEIFGLADEQPQTETTPHHPRSPYAVAKSFAHHLTVNFRESYGLHTCSGILYNHESPLRGETFVTRKITRAAAEISLGLRAELTLGNLDVRRDWGAAVDFVRAMRLVLEQPEPVDYVVATGIAHSLEDFLTLSFAAAGLDDPWQYVRQDPSLVRPADVVDLRGDATKAREQLDWVPQVSFEQLVEDMVRVDLLRLTSGVEQSPSYLPAHLA